MSHTLTQRLLTITAMAWLGQPALADDTSATASPVAAMTPQQVRTPGYFSVAARTAAAGWLATQERHAAAQPAPSPGTRLSALQLLNARVPPAVVRRALATPAGCVDLCLGRALVRVERSTRRVVDSTAESR